MYQTSGYHNQIWCDGDGVPMVRFAVIEDKPHTTTPSESRFFWYDFLCHYSRGEDGSVQYMQDDTIIATKRRSGAASGGPRSFF